MAPPPVLPPSDQASTQEQASMADEPAGMATSSSSTATTPGLPRVLSMDSKQVQLAEDPEQPGASSRRDVWVHIYHCDPYTGFLNRMMLKNSEIGIYHAGIEVYGEEWSFQYFEDTWKDPSISGLIRCLPKRMSGYEYQESLNLGPTSFSEDEVDKLLVQLSEDWPANSYHLTHRNCLTFAEHLANALKPPKPFPEWILGILQASTKSGPVDAMVDYGWSWAKWYMIKKHEQPEEETDAVIQRRMAANDDQVNSSWYSYIFQLNPTCGAICPGPVKRSNMETDERGALVA